MVGTSLALMTATAAGLLGPVEVTDRACAEALAACTMEVADETSPPLIDEALLERCTIPAPAPESRDQGCLDESFMASRNPDSERSPQTVAPTPLRRGTARLPALHTGKPASRPDAAPAWSAQPFAIFELPSLIPPPAVAFRPAPPGELSGHRTRRLERPPRA